MLDENIKELKEWAVAETWLSRHGYGLEQIREQKELWEKAKAPKAAPVGQTTSKVVTSSATKPQKTSK